MRHSTAILFLAAISLVGCRNFDMADPGGLWPFQKQPRTDTVPGLATPAERVATLKQLAERAASSSPTDQERVSKQLAQGLREEEDASLRVEIIRTLAHYPTPTSNTTLRSALSDPEAEVRVAACQAWGQRGGDEAIEVLGRAATGDTDPDVRLTAIRALGKTGDPKATAALGNVLSDSDPAMQRRVMLSLHEVTGKDYGEDAAKWRQYCDGQTPEEDNSLWIVDRAKSGFGLF